MTIHIRYFDFDEAAELNHKLRKMNYLSPMMLGNEVVRIYELISCKGSMHSSQAHHEFEFKLTHINRNKNLFFEFKHLGAVKFAIPMEDLGQSLDYVAYKHLASAAVALLLKESALLAA